MAYRFQKMLDSCTDQTLVDPDLEGILECVDMIRGGETPLKEAIKSIQKRYHNPNPHVAHHALLVLEACVKNCGKKFIAEIATREFMEDMKNLVISNPQEKVRIKILELIQCWTSAFKGIPEYKIVEDTHNLLKMNGFDFPPIDEAKAMFLAESAPDWAEGDNCYRCRVEFGVFTRKHHCRACGQIFCDKCSGKQMLLPQFGIEKKVRVCEACFDKNYLQIMSKNQSKIENDTKITDDEAAREKALKEAQAKEQEEFELALAISQSEAEEKERLSRLYQQYNGSARESNVVPSAGYGSISQKVESASTPVPTNGREEFAFSGMADDSQEQPFDSILAKYLDRDYWERKRRETEEQAMRATAPPASEISVSVSSSVSQKRPHQNGLGQAATYAPNDTLDFSQLEDLEQPPLSVVTQQQDDISRDFAKIETNKDVKSGLEREEEVAETSQFCQGLKERVDTMSTRMRSNQLRGRSIVNDSAIHSLFSQLTGLHGTVLQRMTKLEGQREHFERLQDHLAHIQEARQAVNALREENERQYQERLREEQNRRQTQLRQKLELMRHKKHEMLMTERVAAIQRFQEQERQIRQQRMVQQQSPQTIQQQSPQTIGTGGIAMMPTPTQLIGTPLPGIQSATTIGTMPQTAGPQLQQTHSTPSMHQMPAPLTPHQLPMQTYPMSQPPTQYQMPVSNTATAYQPGIPMLPTYSMPHLPTSQPPFIGNPQMMYAAYPHPGMPTPPHVLPQQFHQMPHYQQYMQPPTNQQSQPLRLEQPQQEEPKNGTTEVPEDLLISFD